MDGRSTETGEAQVPCVDDGVGELVTEPLPVHTARQQGGTFNAHLFGTFSQFN